MREGRSRFVATPERGEDHAETYLARHHQHVSTGTVREDCLMINGVSQQSQNAMLAPTASPGTTLAMGHSSGRYRRWARAVVIAPACHVT